MDDPNDSRKKDLVMLFKFAIKIDILSSINFRGKLAMRKHGYITLL
jgi:hypothetical protein